jgi:hypothetical protein
VAVRCAGIPAVQTVERYPLEADCEMGEFLDFLPSPLGLSVSHIFCWTPRCWRCRRHIEPQRGVLP